MDASAMVGLLLDTRRARTIRRRLRGCEQHVPAHFDAQILSTIGRLERAGRLRAIDAGERIDRTSTAPLKSHPLAPLLIRAWQRRQNFRLVDALYAELAERIEAPNITVDPGRLPLQRRWLSRSTERPDAWASVWECQRRCRPGYATQPRGPSGPSGVTAVRVRAVP